MVWKVPCLMILFFVIAFTTESCYGKQDPSAEDIEETLQLVVNYLGPLLELNEFTVEDVPYQMKYLTAKYYLIFSREIEPLDILETMINDYGTIQNSRQIIEAEDFDEHINHFIELNASNSKKALNKFVTKILERFNLQLQVVRPRDAVQFLLYQEAYPEISEIISRMVRKHYDAYVNERAKARQPPPKRLNETDPTRSPNNDDIDFFAVLRVFVKSHGHLEVVKRFLNYFEQFIPPVDKENVSPSTLDYLDDLQDFLHAMSNNAWRFVKKSNYITVSDEWIAKAETLLSDVLTLVPIQEIFNFFDAIAMNSNDRRALVILRTIFGERSKNSFMDGETVSTFANLGDIFNFVTEIASDAFKQLHNILNDIKNGVDSKVSQEAFLEYIDESLAPHDMSSADLSKEMMSIVTRTFARIDSFRRDQSLSAADKKILTKHLLSFRTNLEKVRDAIGLLIPVRNESNQIELENLLQLIVNKFGAFAEAIETSLILVFNRHYDNSDDNKELVEEIFQAKMVNFAQRMDKLGTLFKDGGTKPSELLKERLLELEHVVDGFVTFATS